MAINLQTQVDVRERADIIDPDDGDFDVTRDPLRTMRELVIAAEEAGWDTTENRGVLQRGRDGFAALIDLFSDLSEKFDDTAGPSMTIDRMRVTLDLENARQELTR